MLGEMVKKFFLLVLLGIIVIGIASGVNWYIGNQVVENPSSMTTQCEEVMALFGRPGTACPSNRAEWWTLISSLPVTDGIGDRQWKSEMYAALLTDCPEQCKISECACNLNTSAVSEVITQYNTAVAKYNEEVQAALLAQQAEQAVSQQGIDFTGAITLGVYISAILTMVGLATLVGLAAFPIPFLKEIGSKISATTLYLIVLLFVEEKAKMTFGIMADPMLTKIVWTSFWFSIAAPFCSLAAFGIGMGAKAIRSAGEGWLVFITTPLATIVSSIGTAISLAPMLAVVIVSLMAMQRGISDPIAIIKASLFGSMFLAPGVTGLFGDLYALVGLIAPMMKMDQMKVL